MASTHDSGSEHDRATLARTGLFVVLAVVVVLVLASWLVFAIRPHTPTLTPGQPQPPAALTLNTGG